MKTIIDLPPNLSPNGIGLALRAIADDILTGAVVPVPPFCYCIDTAVGLVTFWDSESDTLRDPPAVGNQAHPPLGTTLADFTAEQLDRLPVGSAFGEGEATMGEGSVEKRTDGWHYADGTECRDLGDGYDQTRPLIRVGPEQASEPAPSATLPDPEPVREPLPFPVRRYGSCRTWNQPDGEGRFDVGYEFFGCAAGPRDVSESRTFDTEAEGHAWLLSVMMDPGPLPDPWPKMLVDADVGSERHRARIFSAYMIGDRTWACIDVGEGRRDVQWTPTTIREVRTPDGTTVWKRPAAKVTT